MRRTREGLAIACAVFAGCLTRPHVDLAAGEPEIDATTGLEATQGPTDLDGGADVTVADDDAALRACREACSAVDGGGCDGGVCVIACNATGACQTTITCPPGVPCRVECTQKQACKAVTCGDASTCSIFCYGEQACDGNVGSNAEASEIQCVGKEACRGNVSCTGASCTVSCSIEGCKPAEVACCATNCTVNGLLGACN